MWTDDSTIDLEALRLYASRRKRLRSLFRVLQSQPWLHLQVKATNPYSHVGIIAQPVEDKLFAAGRNIKAVGRLYPFLATAYTTFVSTARIREFCTDVRFAWRTRSRAPGSSCSIVPRYPEPNTIAHQSSGALSVWLPFSATTSASPTPPSFSIALTDCGSQIRSQGLNPL